jgi:hypothetical protein
LICVNLANYHNLSFQIFCGKNFQQTTLSNVKTMLS